jgi:DNA repair protein RecN (Recombination protein N)
MLKELRISNLAILPEVTVLLGEGLNVLTGETGAGKSILVDAIGLLAGRRSSVEDVRAGEDQSAVEGVLEFAAGDPVWGVLKAAGVPCDGTELVLRRTISTDGRSRAFVNNVSWTVSGLAQLAPHWIDVSGQHGQQLLLDETSHTDLVDRFGDHADQVAAYGKTFDDIRRIDGELAQLEADRERGNRERDFLSFQVHELSEAKLVAGEDEELAAQHQRAAHAEKLARGAETMETAIAGDDGAIARVARAASELRAAVRMDGSVEEWTRDFEDVSARLEEIGARVSAYRKKLEFDPSDVERINERLSKLQAIARKYGSIENAIAERSRTEKLLSVLEDSGARAEELLREREHAAGELVAAAAELTKARGTAGKSFAQKVTRELKLLGMPSAKLTVESVPLGPDPSAVSVAGAWFGPTGGERIRFGFAPNPGEGVRPLAAIASGGELSRVLLGIKGVAMEESDSGSVTFLFDEVDAGIGGETAERVGIRLKSLALSRKGRQVLCVTHLAQIACYADAHLTVEKELRGGRTHANVTILDAKARKQELARMIGGIEITPRTLDHAGELLRKGGQSRLGL